jgi:hypothetical protein
LIPEAPVQQFHGFEQADLASFMAVALMNEWAFSLITSHDYGRLFVSQSLEIEMWVRSEEQLRTLETSLKSHGIDVVLD